MEHTYRIHNLLRNIQNETVEHTESGTCLKTVRMRQWNMHTESRTYLETARMRLWNKPTESRTCLETSRMKQWNIHAESRTCLETSRMKQWSIHTESRTCLETSRMRQWSIQNVPREWSMYAESGTHLASQCRLPGWTPGVWPNRLHAWVTALSRPGGSASRWRPPWSRGR